MTGSTVTEEKLAAAPGPMPIIFEAVVRQLCINTTWNRDWVVLAPHIVYTRHGEVFVDAVTIARNGMLPREEKIGTYKVAGLGELKLTGRSFAVSDTFEPEAEKYAGVTLIKVEAAAD